MVFDLYLLVAGVTLCGLAMLTTAALTGWREWLRLKQREIDQARSPALRTVGSGSRIEIADLRERVRKLEAIAAGVEL